MSLRPLLLSNTFTNGNILSILSSNKLYLRNAQAIEDIANVDHIVFDKTGTLTTSQYQDVEYAGLFLTEKMAGKIATLARQSTHPMSKAIAEYLRIKENGKLTGFSEIPGKGIEGIVDGDLISLGSKKFVFGSEDKDDVSLCMYQLKKK